MKRKETFCAILISFLRGVAILLGVHTSAKTVLVPAHTFAGTCNAYGHWDGVLGEGVPMRMGRPVLVMGEDVALACVVRCKGHANCRNCHVEDWPDVIVDRRGSSVLISKNVGV